MEITKITALVNEPVHGTIDTVDKTPARAVERVVYAGGKYYLTTEKDGVITNTEITERSIDPRTGRVDLVLPENEAGRKFLTVDKVGADGYTLVPRYGYAQADAPAPSGVRDHRRGLSGAGTADQETAGATEKATGTVCKYVTTRGGNRSLNSLTM